MKLKYTVKRAGIVDEKMLERLFFRLLPVQVLIVAMESVNSIADGIVAARFIGPQTMAVIGLYYTMCRVLEAIGAVLVGGSSVLCGQSLGRGRIDETSGIFSLNLTVTLLTGAVLTGFSLLAPSVLAGLLGANAENKEALILYCTGYALGIVPQLLANQLSLFLQMEHQNARCYAGAAAMIALNVGLNILFVVRLNLGILGLALATSIANWFYFLLLVLYYLSGRSRFHYRVRESSWKKLPELLAVGFPGALLVFCLAMRSLVLNRLLLHYSGSAGLEALTAFNMIAGLLLALGLGTGAVVRMLTSIFIGEEDAASVVAVIRIASTKVLAMTAGIGAVVFLFSSQLAGICFKDHTLEAFHLARQLIGIYSICIPLALICIILSGYYQAAKFNKIVNILSVFDGVLSFLIPALVLAPVLGVTGIWISFPLGMILTALVGFSYPVVRTGHVPRDTAGWLLLPVLFPEGSGQGLEIYLHSREEITEVGACIQTYCLEKGISGKEAFYTALCMEEMTGNVLQHGILADRKHHTVNLYVLVRGRSVFLRIKDDCAPFDPGEYSKIVSGLEGDDRFRNIGIRLVYRIASEVTYQNLVGMNVLTIRMRESGADNPSISGFMEGENGVS